MSEIIQSIEDMVTELSIARQAKEDVSGLEAQIRRRLLLHIRPIVRYLDRPIEGLDERAWLIHRIPCNDCRACDCASNDRADRTENVYLTRQGRGIFTCEGLPVGDDRRLKVIAVIEHDDLPDYLADNNIGVETLAESLCYNLGRGIDAARSRVQTLRKRAQTLRNVLVATVPLSAPPSFRFSSWSTLVVGQEVYLPSQEGGHPFGPYLVHNPGRRSLSIGGLTFPYPGAVVLVKLSAEQ